MVTAFTILDTMSEANAGLGITSSVIETLGRESVSKACALVGIGLSFIINLWATLLVTYHAWYAALIILDGD